MANKATDTDALVQSTKFNWSSLSNKAKAKQKETGIKVKDSDKYDSGAVNDALIEDISNPDKVGGTTKDMEKVRKGNRKAEATVASDSTLSNNGKVYHNSEENMPPVSNGVVSGWWLWSSNSKEPVEDTSNQIEANRVDSWTDWISPYRNAATDYVYLKTSVNERKDHQGTEAPIESNSLGPQNRDTPESHSTQPVKSSWFTWWFLNSYSTVESVDDNDSLIKSAKAFIETSKDNSHYAFKSSITDPKSRDFMLAVSDTHTEKQPVRYNLKKRPLTPNEVQERTLKQPFTNGPAKLNDQNSNKAYPKDVPPEFVFPHLEENFRHITLRTRLRLIGESFLYKNNTSESHLYRSKDSKIRNRAKDHLKKVVIVGVHGFLPIKMVKTLIGHSTGHSIKFVKEATEAFRKWQSMNSENDLHDCDIQTIALEGEGKIEERVSKLLKLLENWIDIILECDFLFFVSHSQGTPVAIQLLAELITKHSIYNKKIGLLGMSGILCGPLAGLDSKLVIRAYSTTENEIMNELFEYQKPTSHLSMKLRESMQILTRNNVKITLSGAVNDQWIPIFSSLGYNFDHPNIFRFLYVDESSNVPEFIISLLKVIAIMRNMGYQDHNLVRDLSNRCMGTIQDGGHCKIYQDQEVYLTAIKHSLETTSLYRRRDLTYIPIINVKASVNLFSLPWNFRGLIHDLMTVRNISNVRLVARLLHDFNSWSPTKHWKELKYCFSALEGIEFEELVL
ncbi:uncharacterized protein PRCAT00000365001 [Priceomyces carsonii]|uniref:uncharacterized protein n=1 Tax=Priceomyces carsonii TaxID=28549 RepID=UPI002ED866DB|nr:unnamed protein product [Priceomyces carsonii]